MEYIYKKFKINKPEIFKIMESGKQPTFEDWNIYKLTFVDELDNKLSSIFSEVYKNLNKKYNGLVSKDSYYHQKIELGKKQYVYSFYELINYRETELGYMADKGEEICQLVITVEFE